MGTGFAATRDIAAFLQHDVEYYAGRVNLLAGGIRTAIIQGASQSGNYIRTFLLLGFNQDEEGRIVFKGAHPHIAARELVINVRFDIAGP